MAHYTRSSGDTASTCRPINDACRSLQLPSVSTPLRLLLALRLLRLLLLPLPGVPPRRHYATAASPTADVRE